MDEQKFEANSDVQRAAADWTIRMDRGLTPTEQDEYMLWLAEDETHREAIKLYSWGWAEFDRLSGLEATRHAPVDPNLLAPGNRFSRAWKLKRFAKWGAFALPAAAAVAVMLYVGLERSERPILAEQVSSPVEQAVVQISRIQRLELPDSSVVELNRGARVEVLYSDAERRLRLLEGEANFKVAKDPSRPFVVEVGEVSFRALGTVFNVKSANRAVDLIVTEGRVQVETSVEPSEKQAAKPVVTVGQRAIVMETAEARRLEVIDVEPSEIEEALLWQPRLLDFDAVPLHRIVEEFNRRNAIQLRVPEAELRTISLSCSFWSDNVEGFVRLLELSFRLEALHHGSEIVLRRSTGSEEAGD